MEGRQEERKEGKPYLTCSPLESKMNVVLLVSVATPLLHSGFYTPLFLSETGKHAVISL